MNEMRTISRTSFFCMSTVLAVVLVISLAVLFSSIGHAIGLDLNPGGWIGGLGFSSFMVSTICVDRFLKLFGLSRSARSVEARTRSIAHPEGNVLPGEVVEVYLPKGLLIVLLATFPSLIWLSAWGGFSDLADSGPKRLACGVLAIGFLFCWLVVILALKDPLFRANADGISALVSDQTCWPKFVPWSDVFSCEIEAHHNTFGKLRLLRPILKAADGKILLSLPLMYISTEDQERFVKYIKARLPKPEIDPWE